jgi:hypothetical protein
MHRGIVLLLALVALASQPISKQDILHRERISPGDLELGGELRGLPVGSTRYVRYEDLLRFPQETYTVGDDTNFPGKWEISGVSLVTVARLFGKAADANSMIVAICYDQYRTNYDRDYVAAHHPVLVLRINGQLRDHWPKSKTGGSLGPYLISHPFFKPTFKVLSQEDEPQIPYGVTRLELRRESVVFASIRPRGDWSPTSPVGQGYAIARQDCFRCHNMGAEGGTMAGRSWPQLAAEAQTNAARFKRTIRNPASVMPGAKGPAHPGYDDATLDALTVYFKTFAAAGRTK